MTRNGNGRVRIGTKTPLMNTIGSLRAVSDMFAVGMSFTAEATAEIVITDGQRNGMAVVPSPIMLGIIPDIMPDVLGCSCSTIRDEKTAIITANGRSMKSSFLKVDTSRVFTLVLATRCSVVS